MSAADLRPDYVRDPSLGLTEKWRRFREDKGRRGGKSGYYLNKWVPWYFYSVLFGAYAWYALAAVPAHHFRDPLWYTISEMFGLYVEIQLLVNWLLIHKTDSGYQPGADDSATLLLEDSVSSYDPAQFPGEPTTYDNDNTSNNNINAGYSSLTSSPQTAIDTLSELSRDSQTNSSVTAILNHSSSEGSSSSRSRAYKTGLTYRMMVATAITSGGEVQRRAFPYWSWVPCLWCRRLRPPRCHHCTLCRRCVLKRDHHCYFTRVCIGVNNQRHFLIFLFWSIVMTSLASFEIIPYTLNRVFSIYSLWNVIFPINLISTLSGQFPVIYLHLVFMMWSLIFLFIISLGMFTVHLFCTLRGITKFEYDNRIKIVNTQSMFARLRAVMGRNWGLAVILPGYINGPPLEDGIKWPYIKP
ncbi:palmitoyltransferase [Plakobranchus ocellatus]|uniref:Palmitoyltransferase n=1 Tax=Plakobranchus ocellatus TaxID=259542 RepID=A0AAV4AFZ2_9GAST|nr:palmitoyltransferase [Plakobranchus ocellatus]